MVQISTRGPLQVFQLLECVVSVFANLIPSSDVLNRMIHAGESLDLLFQDITSIISAPKGSGQPTQDVSSLSFFGHVR